MSASTDGGDVSRRVTFDRDEGVMRAIRTVRESGNSTIVTLPPQILEGANFEVGDDVDIEVDIDSGEITLNRHEPDEE